MKRSHAYPLIFLISLVVFGIYFSKDLCYNKGEFFSLGSRYYLNTSEMGVGCECGGYLFKVGQCSYVSHTHSIYYRLESQKSEQWIWSVFSDAKVLFDQAEALQHSDPKTFNIKFAPPPPTALEQFEKAESRIFEVLKEPRSRIDIQPQIQAATEYILSQKNEYCFREQASKARNYEGRYTLHQKLLRGSCENGDQDLCKKTSAQFRETLKSDEPFNQLLAEPGVGSRTLMYNIGACRKATDSFLFLDCLRGHCSRHFSQIRPDYEVPKVFCLGDKNCQFSEFYKAACFGNYASCESFRSWKEKASADTPVAKLGLKSTSALSEPDKPNRKRVSVTKSPLPTTTMEASAAKSPLPTITKQELPCYIELEPEGFKTSKLCPKSYPDVSLKIPGLIDIEYDETNKKYFGISLIQTTYQHYYNLFEIQVPSGKLTKYTTTSRNFLSSPISVAIKPGSGALIVTRGNNRHASFDFDRNEASSYDAMKSPGRLTDWVSYHAEWDHFVQVDKKGIHLFSPDFLWEKTIVLNENSMMSMMQAGVIGARFQAQSDFLIFDADPHDIAFRVSDQMVFEVIE